MNFLSKKTQGIIYPIVVILIILFLYYAWIINLYFTYPRMWDSAGKIILSIIYIIIFHIIFILTGYCYFYTMFANPGEPPQYWGFYYDSPEVRKQR